MKKVRNKETGVVKVLNSETEVSMYLATGEWEIVVESKKNKPLSQKSE